MESQAERKRAKKELKVGDFVYVTNLGVKEFPSLEKLWKGGTIKSISPEGVAEVHITEAVNVNVQYLTDPLSGDAYDPVL